MHTNPLFRGRALLLAIAIATTVVACNQAGKVEPAAQAVTAPAPAGMAWVNQGEDWAAKKAELQALGERFESSQAMYDKLKADAGGGKPLTWGQMSLAAYDWSGIYTRTKGGLHFDPVL